MEKIEPPKPVLEKTRTYKGDVGFTLMGRRMDDQVVNSRFSRLIIDLSLVASYRDWLAANLGVVQLLTSGQASNLYAVTEGAPSSGTLIDEANLQVDFLKDTWSFSAAAGIVQAGLAPWFSAMYTQSNAGGLMSAGYKAVENGKETEAQFIENANWKKTVVKK